VYSTPAAAVYALDRVLLPDQVFPTEPAVAAAPPTSPMPAARRGNATDDGAPAATDGDQKSSSSCRVGAGRVLICYLAAVLGFGFLC
jgi:hypothetical protein